MGVVFWCKCKVQRNSVVLWELMESGTLDFNGFSDNDENTNDIEVVIAGGAGGSVVVKCAKISGYGSQQHQGRRRLRIK